MDFDALQHATIMVMRLSHIGDCMLTLPMVNALRAQLPKARIVWVLEPPTQSLLRGHAAIDELLVIDRRWRRSPQRLAMVRQQLRAIRPDITLDPQSLTKSALLAWLSGAPRRIGLARPWGRELAPVLNSQLVSAKTTHLVDRSQELLSALGLPIHPARFDLPVDETARVAAQQILVERHLTGRFYLLNPGASWPSKRWSPVQYGRVARTLGQRHQLPAIVTWAGELERLMAEEIVERAGGHAILAPSTTLPELLELIRRAEFFLGSDSGPLHMAAAAEVPCVALFGPTQPAMCGPHGSVHVILQGGPVRQQARRLRKLDMTPIQSIQPDSVIAACEQMIRHQTCRARKPDIRAAS